MPRFNILNPYSLQSLGIFPFATSSEVSSVIKLLKTEGTKAQAALAPFQRSDILRKVSDVLIKRREEFSRTISNETGKTIRDARWEMDRAANTFIASAEAARNVGNGEIQSTDNFGPRKDKLSLIFSRPMGLVLAICPFNFPVNLAAHKIGPAFAGGNTIFLKPHPHGYLSAKLLVDACYEAGMPRESIQVCIPEDSNLRHIAGHPDVNVVNLTGSVAAGKALAREAGYKKLLFELGGNDPLIVLPDANLQLAAQQAVDGRFGTAGQRCTAPKRLFIHETVFADFRDRVVALTSKLKVGDPSLEETDVGPVVHDRAADVVWQRLQSALTNGGKALVGNRRENNLIWPTVVEQVPDSDKLVAEETFGPIMPLLPWKDMDDLVQRVNSTPYGLQAGVFTDSVKNAKALFEALDVGALAVNAGPGFRSDTAPFGGVKESGLGREGVAYAVAEMQYKKTLYM